MESGLGAPIFFIEVAGSDQSKEHRTAQYAKIQGHLAKVGHIKRARRSQTVARSIVSAGDSNLPSDSQAEALDVVASRPARAFRTYSTHLQLPRSYDSTQPGFEDSDFGEITLQSIHNQDADRLGQRQAMRSAYLRDRMAAWIGLTYKIRHSEPDPISVWPKSIWPKTDPLDIYKSNDFFWGVSVPSHTALATIFGFENSWLGWLGSAIREPVFWYAASSLLTVLRNGMAEHRATPSPHVLQFLCYTLEAFRERLKTPGAYSDNTTILITVYLIELSFRLEDFHACVIHRRNLRTMIDYRGGIDNLGARGRVKALVLDYDTYWTIETGESTFPEARPVYTTTKLDRSDTSVQRLLDRLPTGFQRLADSGTLSLDIVHVLERLADSVNPPVDIPHKPLGHPEIHLPLKKNLFQSCPTLSWLTGPDTTLDLESAIALTAILCACRNVMLHRTAFGRYTGVRKRLTRGLPPLSMVMTPAERECWIWIYMVTIESWRNLRGVLEMEGDDLLRQFHTYQSTMPGGRTWKQLDSVAHCFYWSIYSSRSFRASWDVAAERAGYKRPYQSRFPRPGK